MIVLVVMSDGRSDYLTRSVASFAHLHGTITTRIIHDDSGDDDHHAWLRRHFPDFQLVTTHGRQGFAGAYRSARNWLKTCTVEPFILSTEDDFVINRPVDVDDMAAALTGNPHLIQLVLKRQPWNPAEQAAGGIIEQHPDDYTQRAGWVEHRRFFSTNTSVYRRSLLDVEWPEGADSEGHFGIGLLDRYGPTARFAFWGAKDDPPLISHIGHERIGVGY
jgi:hypothetical protein